MPLSDYICAVRGTRREDLTGRMKGFVDELERMLDAVAPMQLNTERSEFYLDDNSTVLRIVIAHSERDDWDLWASVSEEDATAGVGDLAHEHFPDYDGRGAAGPSGEWEKEIVNYFAEIFRGELELTTVRRRERLLSVTQRVLGDDEFAGYATTTGTLSPAWLMFWIPKVTSTERPTFIGPKQDRPA